MDEFLYVRDADENFVPVKIEIATTNDLIDKLIVVTVGNDDYPSTQELIEHVQDRFCKAKAIAEAMRRSKTGNLLILPHIMRLELLSKKELEAKTICVQVTGSDNIYDLPEFQKQLKTAVGKDVVVLPAPLSIEEYKEVKAIKERIKLRKQRHGGGLKKA